jgi:hypothetical protein
MGEHKLIVHRDKLITENTFVDVRNNYIFGREGHQSQMRYSISLLYFRRQYVDTCSTYCADRCGADPSFVTATVPT